MDRESILRMAGGAFEEKVDAEVTRVIDNILNYFCQNLISEIEDGKVVVMV